MGELDGQVALVTGGVSGLGKAFERFFLQRAHASGSSERAWKVPLRPAAGSERARRG